MATIASQRIVGGLSQGRQDEEEVPGWDPFALLGDSKRGAPDDVSANWLSSLEVAG